MFRNKYGLMFFIVYHFVAVVLSIDALESPARVVPFSYDEYFALNTFTPYLLFILGMLCVFGLGYAIAARWRPEKIINSPSVKIALGGSKKVAVGAFFIQNLILLYYAGIIFSFFYFDDTQTSSDGRFLGGKESYLVLLIQASIPLVLWKRPVLRWYSIFMCFSVGFLFSWIDSSRAGVLPLAGVLFASIATRHKILTAIATILAILFYVFSVSARVFQDRVSFDFFASYLSYFDEYFFDIVYGALSYLTSFSIMHFAYVVDSNSGTFGVGDLLYSLTPLPSVFWGVPFETELWRVDQFRPMGAIAEMFRVSWLIVVLFFFSMGFMAKRIDTATMPGVKLITLSIFVLIAITMYQYSLRTVQWYLYLNIALLFFSSSYKTRIKGRTYGRWSNFKR